MKQLVSLALAIVMIMCLSTTAFAETAEAPGNNTAEVTGSYVAGYESNGIVYSVDIVWGDLSFIYHAEKGAVWDPENLTYSEVEPAYWEGSSEIKITNRSNTKISVVPAYAPAEGYGDAGMDFSTRDLSVASAEGGAAQFGTITVTPNGFLPAMEGSNTIGTITLTIAQGNITVEEGEALREQVHRLVMTAQSEQWYFDHEEEFAALNAADNRFTTTLVEIEADINSGGEVTQSKQNELNSLYRKLVIAYNMCAALENA